MFSFVKVALEFLLFSPFLGFSFFPSNFISPSQTLGVQTKSAGTSVQVLASPTAFESPKITPTPSPRISPIPTPIATPVSKPTPAVGEVTVVESPHPTTISMPPPSVAPTNLELDSAVNDYRKSHGMSDLTTTSDLCKAANERAQEIAKNFSHDGWEDALSRNNVSTKSAGENIAEGKASASYVVNTMWDQSPGHKKNLLASWTEGCGAVYQGKYFDFLFAGD